MDSPEKIKFIRCILIVLDEFPQIMQCIMNHSGVDCKFIYDKIQRDTYFKSKKLNPEDMKAIQTLLSDGYTKLDFTLMFKIITHYNIFISPPARGWSSVPNDQETDIGDDAQRLRLERNNLVHMVSATITENQYTDFFKRITEIVKRIDSHIGYFGEASFERRIQKYLSIVIKDEIVENTQKRFLEIEGLEEYFIFKAGNKEFHVWHGKSIRDFIQQMDPDCMTGSTPITLLFPNIEDPGKIAGLIEPLKEEINRGSVLIKLKGAEMGSLILLLVIDNRTFADKNILTVAISDFIIRLVKTLDIHKCFYERNDIVITITEGRECTGNDDRMIKKQNETGSLLLNLEVENAVLMSESNLQDNIEQFLERMVLKINGQKLFNQTELTAIVELNDAVGQFREVSERMKKEFQKNQISIWRENLKHYVASNVTKVFLEKMEKEQCLIITGCQGSGKSSLAYFAALTYEKKNFTILPVSNPNDILTSNLSDSKAVFILDDVVGKHALNAKKMYSLEFGMSEVEKILFRNRQNLKLIITCCSNIFESSNLLSITSAFHLNLHSNEFTLSLDERKELLRMYSNESILKSELSDEILLSHDNLPFVCSFCSNYSCDITNYFDNPQEIILKDLKEKIQKNEKFFVSLALLVVCNNKINENSLETESQLHNAILNDIRTEVNIEGEVVNTDVLQCLDAVQNLRTTLVKKINGIFMMYNDYIFDITVGLIGERLIKTLLKYSSASFIADRFTFLDVEGFPFYVHISTDLADMYFNRLFKDITNGNNWEVFTSNQTQNENYRTSFISFLKENGHSNLIFTSSPYDGTTALHVCAYMGYRDFCSFILENSQLINSKDDTFGSTALHVSCFKGNTEIVNLLVDNKADVNTLNNFAATPLYYACWKGNKDTLVILLAKKGDVNQSDINGLTPLMIACLDGFKEKAEYLLQNGAMVNKSCNNGCTALHYACTKHHMNTLSLIKMLINYNAAIDALNFDGKTPLLNASLLCDEDSCAYLIECNPKEVYHVDKKGFTSLHYACFSGKSIIVDMLLSFNVNLNKRSRNGITPLYMACVQNHKDIAKNLLKHGAVNYLENEDRNCLHAAVLDENKELVKILLKYEANVDIQDSGGITALHVASMKGTFEIVKLLVLHNATINLQNNHGDTPLHFACKGGHGKIVEFLFLQKALLKLNDDNTSPLHHTCRNGDKVLSEILISHGANINQRTKKGITPLHEACNQKHPEIVQLLIQNHSEINQGDNKGIAPLHIACWRGNTAIITELIQQGVNIDNQTMGGDSPLILACSKGHVETVQLLVRHNANTDLTTKKGLTPMYVACFLGHIAIVHILVENNADTNICSCEGCSPLHVACHFNNFQISKLLLEHQALINALDNCGVSPLFLACGNGNIEIVEFLLDRSANVNTSDVNGNTPLHAAVCVEDIDLISMLILYKAKVNKVNKNRTSPLHVATFKNSKCVAELLIRHRAEVNQVDQLGLTPLMIACSQDSNELVEMFIQNKVLINQRNNIGDTALVFSCLNDQVKISELLINTGAIVNNSNMLGMTPLHYAVQSKCGSSIRILLENKAIINYADVSGSTPLHFACKTGNKEIIKTLVLNGADVNKEDNMKNTPLLNACFIGSTPIVQFLLQNKANMNSYNNRDIGPLHIAIFKGHSDILKLLLEHCNTIFKQSVNHSFSYSRYSAPRCLVTYNIVNKGDVNKFTPLHLACFFGQTAAVDLLLRNCAEVNVKGLNNCTPIHFACYRGHEDIVKLLIRFKAHVNITSSNNFTPLHCACISRKRQIVETLIRYNAIVNVVSKEDTTPLHIACHQGDQVIVEQLLRSNAFPNMSDKNGMTPLDIACHRGQTTICQLLVKEGAAVNKGFHNGLTPLYIACQNGDPALVKFLLCQNASINKGIKKKFTMFDVLFMLFRNQKTFFNDLIIFLLKIVLSIGITYISAGDILGIVFQCVLQQLEQHRLAPIHIACQDNHNKIVDILLKNHASANARACGGFSPLHISCTQGNEEITKQLINFNANINCMDNNGITPLHAACFKGHISIVQLLLENGAAINSNDIAGLTPYDFACFESHSGIVKLLGNNIIDKNKVIPCATKRSLIERLKPYCSFKNKLCMFVPHVDSVIRIPYQRTTNETVTNVSVSASDKNDEKQISPVHHITTEPMVKPPGYQGIVGGNNPNYEAEDILNSWYLSVESKKELMIEQFSTSLSIQDVNSNIPSSIDTKTDIKDIMKYTPTLYSKVQGTSEKKPTELTELPNIHIPFMSSLQYKTVNTCTERRRTATYYRLHDFKSISQDKLEKISRTN